MKRERLKDKLFSLCEEFVADRISNAELAMKEAQNSANGEVKSSAGDKHETSRAMAHLEQEKNAMQLDKAMQLKRALVALKDCPKSDVVDFGSLVKTNKGTYYIALSVGAVKLDGENYFIVSPTSPIALALKGLRNGATASFNGQLFEVEDVI